MRTILHVYVCSGFMFIFPFKVCAAPQHKRQNRLEYEVRTTQMYLVSTDLASLFYTKQVCKLRRVMERMEKQMKEMHHMMLKMPKDRGNIFEMDNVYNYDSTATDVI